jgi:hypothetical protein
MEIFYDHGSIQKWGNSWSFYVIFIQKQIECSKHKDDMKWFLHGNHQDYYFFLCFSNCFWTNRMVEHIGNALRKTMSEGQQTCWFSQDNSRFDQQNRAAKFREMKLRFFRQTVVIFRSFVPWLTYTHVPWLKVSLYIHIAGRSYRNTTIIREFQWLTYRSPIQLTAYPAYPVLTMAHTVVLQWAPIPFHGSSWFCPRIDGHLIAGISHFPTRPNHICCRLNPNFLLITLW